jgi:hypothetical protein
LPFYSQKTKTMKIIPDLTPEFEASSCMNLSGTYLHGKLEDDAGHDCFALPNEFFTSKGFPIGHLDKGIYELEFNGKPVTYFVWKNPENGWYRGLAVYNHDKKSVKYAKLKFNEESREL